MRLSVSFVSAVKVPSVLRRVVIWVLVILLPEAILKIAPQGLVVVDTSQNSFHDLIFSLLIVAAYVALLS